MVNLFQQVNDLDTEIELNFDFNLNREYECIAPYLSKDEREFLTEDFIQFLKKGKLLVFNTFCGGLIFLEVPERIERVLIQSNSVIKGIEVHIIYESENRKKENIVKKPHAGKIESMSWDIAGIFPHYFIYSKEIQGVLLLILGRIVKHICEVGKDNYPYMNFENDFCIELCIDGQIDSKQKVKIK